MTAMIDKLEITAREILQKIDELDWTVEQQVVRQVFRAMWSSALTVERIEKIGEALSTVKCDLKPTLTDLVRKKILRSRMSQGLRLYEVNLPD